MKENKKRHSRARDNSFKKVLFADEIAHEVQLVEIKIDKVRKEINKCKSKKNQLERKQIRTKERKLDQN